VSKSSAKTGRKKRRRERRGREEGKKKKNMSVTGQGPPEMLEEHRVQGELTTRSVSG
jgi:hypothetical protein